MLFLDIFLIPIFFVVINKPSLISVLVNQSLIKIQLLVNIVQSDKMNSTYDVSWQKTITGLKSLAAPQVFFQPLHDFLGCYLWNGHFGWWIPFLPPFFSYLKMRSIMWKWIVLYCFNFDSMMFWSDVRWNVSSAACRPTLTSQFSHMARLCLSTLACVFLVLTKKYFVPASSDSWAMSSSSNNVAPYSQR